MKNLRRFNENVEKTFQVPSEFPILIQDLGPNPTVSDVISCWNDCIEDNPIRFYHEGSNKFILEDGESTPEDVFICLNDYLMGDEDEVYEGRTDKASKEKDSDVKLEQFRKTIGDFLKGKNCKTKKVGDDFEVHHDDEHIAQVMFRKDYVGVKKEGNKFPKEFDYKELGKIKSELSEIIKSKVKTNEMKHLRKFNNYESLN